MKKLRILDCSRDIRGRSCQGPEQRIDRTRPRLAGIEGAQADARRAGGITWNQFAEMTRDRPTRRRSVTERGNRGPKEDEQHPGGDEDPVGFRLLIQYPRSRLAHNHALNLAGARAGLAIVTGWPAWQTYREGR